MEKESDLDIYIGTNFFSQHGWHKEKMIIMDPDNVSVLHIFSNGFSEYPIGFLVCRPRFFAEVYLTRVIVEDRPKDRIWCAAISSIQWSQG